MKSHGPECRTTSTADPTEHGAWYEFEELGSKFRIWIKRPPDTVQKAILDGGCFYEATLLRALRPTLPAAARVVDVGANIGNHTLYFAGVCRAREVIAFEPNPDVLPELRANIAANGLTNVNTTHLGIGLGTLPGRAALHLESKDAHINNRGGMSLVNRLDGDVRVARLDELVSGPLDLIKIDVEGMAMGVLEGAEKLVLEARPDVLMEVWLAELPALSDWLMRMDYRISFASADYVGMTNVLLQPRTPVRGFAKRLRAAVAHRTGRPTMPAALPQASEPPRLPASANLNEVKAQAPGRRAGLSNRQSGGGAIWLPRTRGSADLIPIIEALCIGRPREPAARVLDGWPCYSMGSDLLARVFHRWSYSTFTADVQAIDMLNDYAAPIPRTGSERRASVSRHQEYP
jgi:FkbM family methyltransferase